MDDPANTRGESIGPFIVNPPETRIDSIGVDILLPRGLFYANDAGGQDGKEVRWTVEARAVNDEGEPTTGWQTLISGTSYSAWSGWNTTWSTASAVTTQTYHSDSEGGYYSTTYGPPSKPMLLALCTVALSACTTLPPPVSCPSPPEMLMRPPKDLRSLPLPPPSSPTTKPAMKTPSN
jgi:hypothetical protein